MAKKAVASFDDQLKELEQLVTRMERGDLPLEESLQQFERGVQLVRQCEAQLQNAEQKVRILTRDNGTETLSEFTPDRDA